ncbi:late histone H1-like [Mizuhopecten yessoensis]|uniref:Histone H1 n=1 Tax=Mizuhopecten yessoensis TaxID=6573 RepID=A0A210QZ70_MIZYE|nr:late histone H1-like [Mizuhopecten yessoensis]OWF54002.1 Histone H1 [Mizuhopecten yessoensis]
MSAVAPATPKVKKAAKPKKPAAHPTYKEMVRTAVSSLKERGGSSRQAIKAYIIKNYKVNEDKLPTSLKLAIRKGIAAKTLVQVKGSFKLGADAEKKTPKAKKPKKVVKPKAKKATKAKKTGEKKAKPAAKKVKKVKTPKKKTAKSPAKKAAAKPKAAKKSPKKAAKKPAKKVAKKPAAKK